MGLLALFDIEGGGPDLARYMSEMSSVPVCPSGVPVRDLQLDCREIAPSPKELFEKLVENREHVSLIVDEYGSVSGLVTMEDVIETLLGLEIMDESDNVEDLQVLARRNWETRAKRLGIIEGKNKVD